MPITVRINTKKPARKDKECRAVVVGGVNVDIGGQPFLQLVMKDSNPGKVTMSLGGVGRNIAHNLRLLDVPVTFLTAYGEDAFASRIEASCAVLGIDISHARIVPDMHSDIRYLCPEP